MCKQVLIISLEHPHTLTENPYIHLSHLVVLDNAAVLHYNAVVPHLNRPLGPGGGIYPYPSSFQKLFPCWLPSQQLTISPPLTVGAPQASPFDSSLIP